VSKLGPAVMFEIVIHSTEDVYNIQEHVDFEENSNSGVPRTLFTR